MNEIQELDRKSSSIFVREWLKSVSPIDRHGIATFDFANLSGCNILIKELTQKLGNCLDLLLTDVSGVVDPPLDNSDHSFISFSVKMCFNNPNILFFLIRCNLKSRVDWLHVGEDLEYDL